MRAAVFCGSILPLHLFLFVHPLPVRDRGTVNKYKQLQVSQTLFEAVLLRSGGNFIQGETCQAEQKRTLCVFVSERKDEVEDRGNVLHVREFFFM